MMKPVSRTMPPTLGAAMASCMVPRCIREILRPDSSEKKAATVMTPMPPIWMRMRMTAWPNSDQWVAVSCTTRPVTQTAEVAVKRAWWKGVTVSFWAEKGSMSSRLPPRMTAANKRMMV